MNYNTLLRLRSCPDSELADLLFKMADRHPDTFLELITVPQHVEFTVPFTNDKVKMTDKQVAQLRLNCSIDKKVTCIKLIREFTNIGLKEAKDLCEAEFLKAS